MGSCPHCGKTVPYVEAMPPGRSDHCSHCGGALRACVACKHFDTTAYNECHEPSAERVVEKTKANFCEWYKFGPRSAGGGSTRDDMLERARALFKK